MGNIGYTNWRKRLQLIVWSVGMIFLAVSITVVLIYVIPNQTIIYKFAIVVFLILQYLIAWTIRGFYSDTKDTLIADMGDIELEVMKASIEQVLENRNK